jgi:plastocyanin
MYHCHFEDVEHVQMGMTGIVFVTPALGPNYAYNASSGPATAFNRQFALLLNEIWTTPHDNSLHIQETIWTDYKPNYWVINGRSYPDTIKPTGDPSLPSQPISSLIQVNPGDRTLLRFVNLGYEQHSMEAVGIEMRVVGEDATLLRGRDGTDLSYLTNVVYIGPGESRDVLFTAPAFDAGLPTTVDGAGSYNSYLLRNRNLERLTNNGGPGLGGMVTEIRVYQSSPLPAQPAPNRTFPL